MNQVNQNPTVSVSYAVEMLPPDLAAFGKEASTTMVDQRWDPFPCTSLIGFDEKINVHVDKWFIGKKFRMTLLDRVGPQCSCLEGVIPPTGLVDDIDFQFNTRLAVINFFGLDIVYNQDYVAWFRENIKDFLVEAYCLEPDNVNSLRVFQDKTYTAKEWFCLVADHIYLNDI